MPCWNYLPAELKQHVVKKLDFMSRHSLQNTSHLYRLIVNSINIQLPRVRFGYKEEKCLIVIYTGIDKFLRMEFEKYGGGVVVRKFENTCDRSDVSTKLLPSSDLLKVAISILKSLFAHQSIIIKAMEWDISKPYRLQGVPEQIYKLLDGALFRVNEMVFAHSDSKISSYITDHFCYHKDVKLVRQLRLIISRSNLAPVSAMELVQFMYGKHSSYTALVMTVIPPGRGTDQLLPQAEYIEMGQPETRINHPDGFIIKTFRTPECGTWDYHKGECREMKHFENIPCGPGPLCKRCTDPFDYWYNQNLPRRILHEPFWTDLISDEIIDGDREKLREKYEEDEKGIQKQTSEENKSWGFKIGGFVENMNWEKEKKNSDGNTKSKNVKVEDSEEIQECNMENICILTVLLVLITSVSYLIIFLLY